MAYGKNNSRPGHTGGSKGSGPQGGGRKAKGAPQKLEVWRLAVWRFQGQRQGERQVL